MKKTKRPYRKYNLRCLATIDMSYYCGNWSDDHCILQCSGDRYHGEQHFFEVPFLRLTWYDEASKEAA